MGTFNSKLHFACGLVGVIGFAPLLDGRGAIADLYKNSCAACHGERLEGGTGGALNDGIWVHGSTDEDIARGIREGFPDNGMPGWQNIFSEEQIRAMVIYIREQEEAVRREGVVRRAGPQADGNFQSDLTDFTLETVAPSRSGDLWAIQFLPDGRALITERSGDLWLLDGDTWRGPIQDTPKVHHQGQGGLLDVALHPDYAEPGNGWIYLSYSHEIPDRGAMTRIVRGRLDGLHWTDEALLYEAPAPLYLNTRQHYGSRFAFRGDYFFFSIGDRGRQDSAQDRSTPSGNIFRLHHDGRIPADNPFLDVEGALPEIWSYGHRNPQGLAIDPRNGNLWSTEHGPRGGDELNLIEGGLNYGWPVITYGMNYNGTPITEKTAAPGMEQPKHQWTPSIAVCGIEFYTGDAFPAWKNNLFVTGLAAQEVQRVEIIDRKVVTTEVILKNQGRVRDIRTGPDGFLYVLLVEGNTSYVKRLRPVGSKRE